MKKIYNIPSVSKLLLTIVLIVFFLPSYLIAQSGNSQSFSYTYSSAGSFTLYGATTSVAITAYGGGGGYGGIDCGAGCTRYYGGNGGYTSETYSIASGTTIAAYPGYAGGNGGDNVSGGGAGSGGGSTYSSSYNGGAGGRTGSSGSSGGGGGGGAPSVVSVGGTIYMMAAGGGGAGGACNTANTGQTGSSSFSSNGTTYGGTGSNVGGNDGGGGGGGGGGWTGGAGGGLSAQTGNEWYGLAGYAGQNYGGSSSGYGSNSGNGYVVVSYTGYSGTISGTSSVCSGGLSALSLSGYAGSSIQWQYSPNNSSWYNISGATSTSYNAYPTSSTYYRVVIGGSLTSGSYLVSVSTGPTNPSSLTGTVASLAKTAATISWGASTGTGTITYYWVLKNAAGTTIQNSNTTATSVSLSSLSSNTVYYFTVYANNLCGNSLTSTSGNFATYPDAPTASVTTPVCIGNALTLSATATEGTVYWYNATTNAQVGTGTSLSLYPTAPATTISYYAKNYSNGLYSAASSNVSVVTKVPATVPGSATVTAYSATTANLSWAQSTATDAITYNWVVGTSATVTYGNGTAQATTSDPTLTAIASGLTSSTTYYLRVFATTNSPCSNSVYQTSASFTTVPTAPVSGAATLVRANSFSANWASSTGATKYFLDVSTSATFATFLSGYNNKDVANIITLNLSGLARNTIYYYRVRAYNAGGQSLSSSTQTLTTLGIDHFLIEKPASGNIPDQTAGTPFSIKLTAQDSQNTTVTDFSSTVAVTTNSTLTAGGTSIAFTNGVLALHSVTLTLTGANKTLTVAFATESVSTTSNTFTLIPADINNFTLVANGGAAVTAGVPFSALVTVYDQYANVKTNYTGDNSVTWSTTSVSSSSGQARVMPANGLQTFTAGVATVSGFTFYNSDQTQLTPFTSPTITITDSPTSKAGTTTVVVKNTTLDNFKLVAGTVQTSGTAFGATVTARDIYWNTCVDYAGSIRFKSSDDLTAGNVNYPGATGLQSFAPATTYKGVRAFSSAIVINNIGAYWLRAADSQFAYKTGDQQNIVVSPGAFSPSTSTLTIDSNTKIAGQSVLVTLTPRDAQGNLLSSCQNITLYLDGILVGTEQTYGSIAGSDGIYIFNVPVTSTTATNLITAKLNAVPFSQSFTITVSPAPPSLSNTTITPDAATISTDGSQLFTVQLKDQYNNNRTTNDGTVTLTTDLAGFGDHTGVKTVTSVYAGSGNYTTTLYPSTDGTNGAGTATISGSVAFNATPGPGNYIAGISPNAYAAAPWPTDGAITDHGSVTITEGLPSLATTVITANPTSMTTDGTSTVTIQLKDALGNLIVNNRGTVTLSSTLGFLSAVTYVSNGLYTATLTGDTRGTNGTGTATITGAFTGSGTASSVLGAFADNNTTVVISEGLPNVSQIQISTAVGTITADGNTLVTVQLEDQFGNLIVNNRATTLTLSTNLGVIDNGISVGATNVTANYTSAGKYTATFKMNGIGVGNATITGKYNTVAITDNAIVAVTFGAATQLNIQTQPAQTSQAIAGTAFSAQPEIRIKDQWGNLVTSGGSSTAAITATRLTGTSNLQGTSTINASGGIATFSNLSYNTAELINIQFSSGLLTVPTSTDITVVHNVPSYMIITGNSSQTAGVAQTITIKAYDAYGNPANRFTGNKTLTFSGASDSPTPPYHPTVNGTNFGTGTTVSFTGGIANTASMILYKEETAIVAANFSNASYTDTYTGTTSVNINAATTNRLTVNVHQAIPAYLAITGSGSQVAGSTQTITLTAYDGFNNVATNYSGTKTMHFAGASASLAPSTNPTVNGVIVGSDVSLTFANGVATATMALYKVESALITAVDQATGGIATTTGYKLAVNVTHAAANYYAVTGASSQTAGTPQTISVTAFDAYNNVATAYTGSKNIVFSGANSSPTPSTNPTVAGTAFGTATALTFSSGVATGSMNLYKTETAEIVATTGLITTP